mgnify:CR=1 FL=1
MDFGTMRLGDLIERLLQLVKDHRLAITPDVTLLARSMITIEGTLSACAPGCKSVADFICTYVQSADP